MNSLSINTTEERRWAAGTHVASLILAFLTSWAAGLAGMLGAAAVLLLKPANGSPFVEQHAKEAFNFNLSMFVYWLLGWILAVVTLGLGLIVILPIALVLAIVWVVCSIKAAMNASDGQEYRYPFTFRVWR
jgi:uncharacterized Tic20 family protein